MNSRRSTRALSLVITLVTPPALAEVLTGHTREDGRPLAGVELLAIDPASRAVLAQTLSGADGSFTLRYRDGLIELRAFLADYAPLDLRELHTRDTATPLTLHLIPDAFSDSPGPPAAGDCP